MEDNQVDRHLHPAILSSVIGVYLISNFIAVRLSMAGVIFPPWNMLMFFSVLGPAMILLGLSIFQSTAGRHFSRPAVIAHVLVIAIVAIANLRLLGLASAQV
jgi:hypothetical protein